jgi:hypothetical protein
MWALFVVILPPSFGLSPCIAETSEPVRVQTFVAQSAVEALDVGILRGLAWLNELQPRTALFAPGRQCPSRGTARFWQRNKSRVTKLH